MLSHPHGVTLSSEILGITPKQSDPCCYGLQKATPLQDEQYQKRVDQSTLSECLSAERLQDFPPVLSALRISQQYTKCTPCKIPSTQAEIPEVVMWK